MNQEHTNLGAIRQTCTIRDRESSLQRELKAKNSEMKNHMACERDTHTHTYKLAA